MVLVRVMVMAAQSMDQAHTDMGRGLPLAAMVIGASLMGMATGPTDTTAGEGDGDGADGFSWSPPIIPVLRQSSMKLFLLENHFAPAPLAPGFVLHSARFNQVISRQPQA
jgi:hypothetical protein